MDVCKKKIKGGYNFNFNFSSLFTVGGGTGIVESVDSLVDLLRQGEPAHTGDQAMETVSGLGLETAPHSGGKAMETAVSGLGLEFVTEFQL